MNQVFFEIFKLKNIKYKLPPNIKGSSRMTKSSFLMSFFLILILEMSYLLTLSFKSPLMLYSKMLILLALLIAILLFFFSILLFEN